MATTLDAFDLAYDHDRRRLIGWSGTVIAACAACTALFALATSLPALRWACLILTTISLPTALLAIVKLRQEGTAVRHLRLGAIATTTGGVALTAVALLTPGFGLALEPDYENLEQMQSTLELANQERTKDPEVDTIRRLLEQARNQPGPVTFRALVPYLDRLGTTIAFDGEVREVSSWARDILHSDKKLYLRSLHDEAQAMAALLPAGASVPESITVDVARRLDFALKNLIHAHSEQKMGSSFDLPLVGVKLTVALDEVPEGAAPTSEWEIGLTYPVPGHENELEVHADAATVPVLLKMLREDLDF